MGRTWSESMAFKLLGYWWANHRRYEFSTRILRSMQKLVARDGKIGKVGGLIAALAPPLAAWTVSRDAPPLAPRSFRDEWKKLDDRN
jgi:hypothetical protein